MSNVVPIGAPPPTALTAVQSVFALAKLDGQLRIVDLDQIRAITSGLTHGAVDFYKKADGETLIRRYLETLTIPASGTKGVIANFWVDPKTRVYDATAFSPLPTPATTLNFWIGSTVTPAAGNWSTLKDFLLHIICAGDQTSFQYLIRFLAHMLQRPEEKPGIMIVLLGAQGTGKGAFFNLLRSVWPRTVLFTPDVDQVIGGFNAALERHYIVCLDEAFFSGDKKAIERLKSLITEPVCRIEQKYQPSRTIDSYHRLFAASNHEHFANIERDDRRFLFLRVSNSRQQDRAYFDLLFREINDPAVIAAMTYDLMQMDISQFNVRHRPRTKEHLNQKIQSLAGFDRYWFEVLTSGMLDPGDLACDAWENPRFTSTENLTFRYKKFDRNSERYRTVTSQQIATSMTRLCPEAKPTRHQKTGGQKRGYDLPSIKAAREAFEGVIGGAFDWEQQPDQTDQAYVPPFNADQLMAMRETYDLDEGSVGPEGEYGALA